MIPYPDGDLLVLVHVNCFILGKVFIPR